jgi:tRNA dimethylallyltransferase
MNADGEGFLSAFICVHLWLIFHPLFCYSLTDGSRADLSDEANSLTSCGNRDPVGDPVGDCLVALPVAYSLLAVVGPTASGKSDLALFLASRLGGEIVNCDSLQVYRGFDIGTAKAIAPDVPHHLFDILDPLDTFTAGEYARRAAATVTEIAARGRLPVLAGGTGFYLRALLEGLAPAPERNEELRTHLGEHRAMALHRLLRRLDPAVAGRVHPNDKPKIMRALEVCVEARRPMSSVWAGGRQGLEGFHVVKLGLNPPRPQLYERINQRTHRMYERGLVDEVRALLAAGIPETAKPFEAPGYTEALAVVRGTMTPAEAIDLTQRRTRQYAKRQTTWFRKERDMNWLPGFGDDPSMQQLGLDIVTR